MPSQLDHEEFDSQCFDLPMLTNDHACSFYDSADDLRQQFAPFLQAGLLLGERCVYFINENSTEFVLQSMRTNGFDLEPFLKRGAFQVIHTDDAHLNGGHFTESKMLSYWAETLANARSAGFDTVRAAVEMTWALSNRPGCEILAPYEARLTRFVKQNPVSILCMYSREKYPAEKLKAVLHAHPIVVVHDQVLPNPAVVGPEHFEEGCAAMDLQAAIGNLAALKRSHDTRLRLQEAFAELEHVSSSSHRDDQSEISRFASIVENCIDAIISITLDGYVTTWNRGAEKMFRYPSTEAIGILVNALLPNCLDLPIVVERFARNQPPDVYETTQFDSYGKRIEVSSRLSPIKDSSENIVGISAVLSDITERKKWEQIALRNEHSLRLSLKASKTGVWTWKVTKDEITWDAQTVFLLTGSIDDHRQVSFDDFMKRVHPGDAAFVRETIGHAVATKSELYLELRVIWLDNTIHHIATTGIALEDEMDGTLQFTGVCSDITHRRRDVEHAKRLAVLEQREEFMTALTHDLKNPLVGANSVLEVLAAREIGRVFPKEAQMLLSVRDSNNRLLSSIQNLIDVYRVEIEITPQTLDEMNLVDLLRSSILEVQHVAEEKNVSIKSEISVDVKTIRANSSALRRVVENLIGNALKFASAGDAITVALRDEGPDSVTVEIADTGPGISSADQERLFKRFSQGVLGKRYTSGSGLGLYLCKQIIESHNGTIHCRSVEGTGSTFSFTIPI